MLCICKYPNQFEFTITIHINLMNHVPTAWYMYLSQSCISPFTNISRVTFAKSKHNPVQLIQTQKYMTQCTCVYLCVYIDILMHLFYVYTCIYKYMCVLFIRWLLEQSKAVDGMGYMQRFTGRSKHDVTWPHFSTEYWNMLHHRRKFRSQTSDNMERWKAEQGRGREKRKIRREKIRRERVRRQKIQMREKVGKSRNTVFFQWFVAPEGRKVGSLKRRVRSQLATGAMKNCAPLWREAHFQVKMYKTPQRRTTFGSWDVKKMHAVVARSTFRSQKC